MSLTKKKIGSKYVQKAMNTTATQIQKSSPKLSAKARKSEINAALKKAKETLVIIKTGD